MKILWIKSDFLHPTTRGGQIRTLETLRCLHQRHEIHYVAVEDPGQPEGPARSREYCSRAYPVRHRVPGHGSPAFYAQAAAGLFSSMPVAISRFRSGEMRRQVDQLMDEGEFDRVVCDFLTPAPNISRIERCLLFQHNVETVIWQRRARSAPDPARRAYFRLQAARMCAYEKRICRQAGHVIAVSESDARTMRDLFGVSRLSVAPTGVDVEWFAPAATAAPVADLVFLGSMDWLPNVDGIGHFVREALPLIRRRRPECSLAIVGRTPAAEVLALAQAVPGIQVTGTVPDVRPYLWGSRVAIVPLRIGSGTRLKIYEAMAARVPVVSTTVGAEGLEVRHPENIRLADTPEAFAGECLDLLEHPPERERLAQAGCGLVKARFSWEEVSKTFDRILEAGPCG
ncbi:MAG TPA: glycosyltransferase [Bryobacteraceae bacterium]|nr:glycosyltransferase [Bryobacteraceae bacterium]